MSYFEIPANGKAISFRIRQQDEDLVDWYFSMREGDVSAEIREAIRFYIRHQNNVISKPETVSVFKPALQEVAVTEEEIKERAEGLANMFL